MGDMTPWLIAVMAFGCVSIIIFMVGRYMASQATMHRRLPIPVSTSQSGGSSDSVVPNFLRASLAGTFDEKTFGIEGPLRTKLRRNLIRAGYFSDRCNTFIHICSDRTRTDLTRDYLYFHCNLLQLCQLLRNSRGRCSRSAHRDLGARCLHRATSDAPAAGISHCLPRPH